MLHWQHDNSSNNCMPEQNWSCFCSRKPSVSNRNLTSKIINKHAVFCGRAVFGGCLQSSKLCNEAICWGWGKDFFGSQALFLLGPHSLHPCVLHKQEKKKVSMQILSAFYRRLYDPNLYFSHLIIYSKIQITQEHTTSWKWERSWMVQKTWKRIQI